MIQPVYDPNSGQYVDAHTGHVYDPNSGMLFDPGTGAWYTPAPDPAPAAATPAPAPKKKKKQASHAIPRPEPIDDSVYRRALSNPGRTSRFTFISEIFKTGEHTPYEYGLGIGCGILTANFILGPIIALIFFFLLSLFGFSLGSIFTPDPPKTKKIPPAKVYKKDTQTPLTASKQRLLNPTLSVKRKQVKTRLASFFLLFFQCF